MLKNYFKDSKDKEYISDIKYDSKYSSHYP